MPENCEPSDESLMLQAGRGDTHAFEELIRRHQNTVYGTIVRMLGNLEGADDIAQEVFLRAWKSAPRYRPEAKFTTWLLTIVRNLVFNECRKRRRPGNVSLDSSTPDHEHNLEMPDSTTPSADSLLAEKELQAAIDQALSQLGESARLAIILRRFEDMPYEEIAGVLKLSVPAVKSLLFRARADLRRQLAAWLPKNSQLSISHK